MADNFGSRQSRVLNVGDRSLDQVVFQERIVPLSSEWNLINQIGDFKTQEAVRVAQPSGWLKVGNIYDTGATSTTDTATEAIAEGNARSGDVLTSLTYDANKFKIAAREQTNIAIVNGWPIIVQNPASQPLVPVIPNPITGDVQTFLIPELLDPTGTYHYDIVFLEVWRKLVGVNDYIYPYGNVGAPPVSDNEILWSVIGSETTKRIQIQYRVRTVAGASYASFNNPQMYPDGLGWSGVRPVGGNTEGSYVTTSGYHFKTAGARDAGLYIAGDGSTDAKELLNTVDGYVYAIPMFMVYRRAKDVLYTNTTIHGSYSDREDLVAYTASDRPDGKYSDIIYADDIIDTRHQLVTSGKDLDFILQESFRKLVTGQLKTTIGIGFSENLEHNVICSGASEQLKVEELNGTGGSLPNIGDGVGSSDFKRRSYANCETYHPNQIAVIPYNGASSWEAGVVTLSTEIDLTGRSIVSIEGLYDPTLTLNPITGVTISTSTLTIASGSNLIGTTTDLYVQYTYKQNSSSSTGFHDVPETIYECGKSIYAPIPTRGNNIPVRYENNHSLVVGPNSDYVRYAGGNYRESYDFGVELVYHYTFGISGNSLTVTCVGGKLYNYPILGVKSVLYSGVHKTISAVTRTVSGVDIIFEVTFIGAVTGEVQVVLSVGHTFEDVTDIATKFFEFSKQGCGVVETYEYAEIEATRESSGIYILDSGTKPIIALGVHTELSGGITIGKPYAFVPGTPDIMADIQIISPETELPTTNANLYLPINDSAIYSADRLPTRIKITVDPDPGTGTIKVPVLLHSYVEQTESPYFMSYKFVPYQGLLSTTEEKGKIEASGPAIITSEGSGAINNLSYSNGSIIVNAGSRVVEYVGSVGWSSYIKAGDYLQISGNVGIDQAYQILHLGDEVSANPNTKLTLVSAYDGDSSAGLSYSIFTMDTPAGNVSNIFNRMPTTGLKDYRGKGTPMSLNGVYSSMVEVVTPKVMQDPLDTIVNDFILGDTKSTNSRGRNEFVLTAGSNTVFKIGQLTPYIEFVDLANIPDPLDWPEMQTWDSTKGYKKAFKAYLFNKAFRDNDEAGSYRDLMGKMYLLVVSTETGEDTTEVKLNAFSDQDAVEIYELIGRPIIRTL